jgi:ATP-binding cassette, subfamily C (CFTR/MRP), member 1
VGGIVFFIATTNPWLFLLVIPLGAAFFYISHLYMGISRNLRRTEAISRSPVFAHFVASKTGLPVIRSLNASQVFDRTMMRFLDENGKAMHALVSSTKWLCMRVDFIVSLLITATACICVASRSSLSPGDAALSIVYSLQLIGFAQYIIKQVHGHRDVTISSCAVV